MKKNELTILVALTVVSLLHIGCEKEHSNPLSIDTAIDYEGKTYHVQKIGDQFWLKENLHVGTPIHGYAEAADNGAIEEYCYYDDTSNCSKYGGMYQWNEAMQYSTTPGARGICPPGWHIPTIEQFQALMATVGGDGNALKDTTQGVRNGRGTNTSGFAALLAGFRFEDGAFYGAGMFATFWTSSGYDSSSAHFLYLYDGLEYIDFDNIYASREYGMCVRCIKD